MEGSYPVSWLVAAPLRAPFLLALLLLLYCTHTHTLTIQVQSRGDDIIFKREKKSSNRSVEFLFRASLWTCIVLQRTQLHAVGVVQCVRARRIRHDGISDHRSCRLNELYRLNPTAIYVH